MELPKGTLSETDIDVLSGMMIIFLKAAEKCMQTMELHYEAEYRAGKEYKAFCKLYGKAATDAVVSKQVRKIMRGDERNKLGLLLKKAGEFHTLMDTLVQRGMESHTDETDDVQTFDAIQHDTNVLCYMYALMGNCTGKDDEIKLLSTVKAMAKNGRVSQSLLDKLKMQ